MPSTTYLIVKSLHVISIISWMAGILYLFRLFVYHVEETESLFKTRLSTMQWRLYRYITVPAMVASLVFGLALMLIDPSLLAKGWLHGKLLMVAGLVGMTLFGGAQIDELKQGTCKHSSRMFRLFNEVPTVIMIGIVFLVILKPFG
jgi:protoporphyrinogen IX oxidase